MLRAPSLLLVCLAFAACGTATRRSPVPKDLAGRAEIPGFRGIRAWALLLPGDAQGPGLSPPGPVASEAPADVLALSGGGGDGSFGAGILRGWTESGRRPEFHVVTGVSVGALLATFAFLGPEHDGTLERIFADLHASEVYEGRGFLFPTIFGDSLESTAPLRRMVEREIDGAILGKVAEQHARGRRLYVATTNLDSQRAVVWDLGAIAASGHPGALALFRNVLMASAAIPVAFPPVYFDVEADGRRFDEMHVDGGVCTQVFFNEFHLGAWAAGLGPVREGARLRVWIVRNGRVEPEWHAVEGSIAAIASQSLAALVRVQGAGDLYRMHAFCARFGFQYHYIGIPERFPDQREDEFDNKVLRELYEAGRAAGREPDRWAATLPGLEPAR